MAGNFRITYKVSGFQKILLALQGKRKAMIEGLVEGVDKGSVIVEAKSKEIVPVRTGNLMRSIHTQFRDGGLRALVGPDIKAAPYAYYVEFGRSKSGKIPPYPFEGRHYMEHTFYMTRGQVSSIIQTAVRRAIA